MPNIRTIRRRIRSVQNTAKITQAMEMIAASKMRRAQQRALAARPYAQKMFEVLGHLGGQSQRGEELHPLAAKRGGVAPVAQGGVYSPPGALRRLEDRTEQDRLMKGSVHRSPFAVDRPKAPHPSGNAAGVR